MYVRLGGGVGAVSWASRAQILRGVLCSVDWFEPRGSVFHGSGGGWGWIPVLAGTPMGGRVAMTARRHSRLNFFVLHEMHESEVEDRRVCSSDRDASGAMRLENR